VAAPRKADRTIAFLRMAAIELRRIAENEPQINGEIRYIADQLEAQANDLAQAGGYERVGFV